MLKYISFSLKKNGLMKMKEKQKIFLRVNMELNN